MRGRFNDEAQNDALDIFAPTHPPPQQLPSIYLRDRFLSMVFGHGQHA